MSWTYADASKTVAFRINADYSRESRLVSSMKGVVDFMTKQPVPFVEPSDPLPVKTSITELEELVLAKIREMAIAELKKEGKVDANGDPVKPK